MENRKKIHLNVKTVPAFDPVTMGPHTAFTVFCKTGSTLLYASGWTLKDAIELYACQYGCNPEDIRLIRPFRPR